MSDTELAGLTGENDGDEMFADLGHFETGAIPVDAVVKRGKAIRSRRRVIGGGALAAATALTIAVPVALAGGSSEGAKPTAGHAIAVERPYENAAHLAVFSGSLDGKAWSRTLDTRCDGPLTPKSLECLPRVVGLGKQPVGFIGFDDQHPEGDFYFAELGPDTDFMIATLDTGDQVTAPGLAVDDGYHAAYFELPRRTAITKVVAYDKNGREIAHAEVGAGSGKNRFPGVLGWYRPDGGKLDTSVPTVHVAAGTTDGTAWSIDVTDGVYDACFTYKIGADAPTSMCPSPGAAVFQNGLYNGGHKDAVVVGQVDPKTTRVDVTFKDGTVRHLIPTRSNGRAFVGTYVPVGATVVSVTPVTGTNG